MKLFSTIAAMCLSVTLIGCGTTQTADTSVVAPGAVGVCQPGCSSACCAAKAKASADLGAVSDNVSASQCPFAAQKAAKGDTNFGAVSDKPSGCSAQCPSAGKKAASPNLGAVSDKPSGCTSQCPSIGKKAASPSLGAISDGSGCPASQCPLYNGKNKTDSPSLGAVSDATGCSKAARRSGCCSAAKAKKSDS